MHVTGPGISVTGPGTSDESSNASSTRGSFKTKPTVPIVDIQDCSDMRQNVNINYNNTNEEAFGEDVDDFDEELAATMNLQSPGGLISRNVPAIRSPTVLTPPHSTPR